VKIQKQELEKWLVEYAIQCQKSWKIIRRGEGSAREFINKKILEQNGSDLNGKKV